MTTEPFREKPSHVPVADYDRVCAENAALRVEVRTLTRSRNRRETLGKVARGLAWFTVTVPVAALIVYGVWFVCVRGVAWGERARRNAEREATAYVTRTRGVSPLSVVCDDAQTHHGPGTALCNALMPDRSVVEVECDDDDPVANDGCVPFERRATD